ncbi:hypothetical protein, partial [Caballeronia sordidicola]|uniref:hypothetical protein n=1 Tax=Caballeronia sordidicola TaxID=196367 RepID=UPI0012FE3078
MQLTGTMLVLTRHIFSRPYFNALRAYVLLFKDRQGDWCIDALRSEQGRAITCFLSPFDAMIEAAQLARSGQSCRVMPASDVEKNLFCDADERGLLADIVMGWTACNKQIITRPGGAFGRSATVMHHWAVYPSQFEVDEFILAEYVGYRERAGLFAWQETAAGFLRWPDERRYELAERALASTELTHGTAQDCDEIALYDPEFEQWHFVPYTGR